tara:strand:+ start:99 stop:854 length:756 start_codon:yes stop_codon:yes gene_type:complete
MANQSFNVNTNATIALTAKLERLNKQAFPSAVRSTLNDAAFAMKKGNILESAKKNMTVRNPAFFRKFTGVNRANGFDVRSMNSEVGFVNTDPNKEKGRKAIEGMEHNEVGGSDDTGAMYLPKSRTSNSSKRLVKKKARFSRGNIATGTSSKMKTKKLNFIANAYASAKENKPTFIQTSKGSFLVQVTKFSSNHSKLKIKMNFLMRSRRTHAAHAKATHFNLEAAMKTQKEMEGFYVKNAEFQFNKVLKSTR